jgi:hypothetical protein
MPGRASGPSSMGGNGISTGSGCGGSPPLPDLPGPLAPVVTSPSVPAPASTAAPCSDCGVDVVVASLPCAKAAEGRPIRRVRTVAKNRDGFAAREAETGMERGNCCIGLLEAIPRRTVQATDQRQDCSSQILGEAGLNRDETNRRRRLRYPLPAAVCRCAA